LGTTSGSDRFNVETPGFPGQPSAENGSKRGGITDTPKSNGASLDTSVDQSQRSNSYKREKAASKRTSSKTSKSHNKLNSIKKNIEDKISSIRDSFGSPQLSKELDTITSELRKSEDRPL